MDDFLVKLNDIDLLRPIDCPSNIRQCCIFILEDQISLINELLAKNPNIVLRIIVIPVKNQLKSITVNGNAISVISIEEIGHYPELEKLILAPSVIHLTNVCRFLAKFDINHLWIVGDIKNNFCQRPPVSDYLHKHETELKKVYSLFDSGQDRDIFLRRIKAILTGNSAYLPVSPFIEYHHPEVQPEKDDIMIDGGISDMVRQQELFARRIGDNGRIYGFEPIKWMADIAAEKLKKYNNYSLIRAGLADKAGKAYFTSSRDSSHLSDITSDHSKHLECELVTIDEFCMQNNIQKVSCIKLDIEGAELQALKGAKMVIERDCPKLIICLYHKPEDLYEIPLYIKSLHVNYIFHIAHSSSGFNDTILYATKA